MGELDLLITIFFQHLFMYGMEETHYGKYVVK